MVHPTRRPRAGRRLVSSPGRAVLLRAVFLRAIHLGAIILGAILTVLPSPADAQDPLSLADPELTRTIQETVVRHSPDLASARAHIAASRVRASVAGAAPPLVLSGGMEEVPEGFDVLDGNVTLRVGREFLTGGRGEARERLARTEVGLAEARLLALQRRLEARTLQRLARVVTLTRTGARLAAEDSLLASVETALRDRFSVGDARYVDVLRLRTARLRTQTDRARAQAEARAEREALSGLAGPDGAAAVSALVDSALALPATADAIVPPPPSLDSLLALSGEIRVAGAAVERAAAVRDLTRAEQRPLLSASVGAQRRVSDGSNVFGPVIGGSVTLPFSRRDANRAEGEATELEIEAAEADLAATTARVRAALAAALAHYDAARERVDAIDSALLQGARDEREAALGAYRGGDLTLLELLDFERALSQAEIERLHARADAAEAWADLISAATGEGESR